MNIHFHCHTKDQDLGSVTWLDLLGRLSVHEQARDVLGDCRVGNVVVPEEDILCFLRGIGDIPLCMREVVMVMRGRVRDVFQGN